MNKIDIEVVAMRQYPQHLNNLMFLGPDGIASIALKLAGVGLNTPHSVFRLVFLKPYLCSLDVG